MSNSTKLAAQNQKPLGVSIICCTYNGKNRLQKTFDGIRNLIYDEDWEFILVDNNSNDGTTDFAKSYLHESNIVFKLLQCPTPGKNFALWMAFEAVNYRYILICDDDNQLFPDYLATGVDILEKNSNIGAMGGIGIMPDDISKPEWFDRYQLTYAIGSQAKKNGSIPKGWGLYGAGCFLRESGIRKLIELDLKITSTVSRGKELSGGEDIEICLALECLGFSSWFDENLKFYHHIEEQRLRWDYLLKLKSSIASNFPILEPYRFVISGESGSYLVFVLKQIPSLIWNFAFIQIVYFLRPQPKNKVFRIIYQYQMKGLFKNFRRSLNAFQKIKPIFLLNLNYIEKESTLCD
ncbi:glycosyltransferase family 2 protein [Litoribacter populi]|uniref:glycosyltransferase family 2 protein n=1 Tax=Litoribacter populi TaxID=2598460 RepID=UPI00117D229E|nr:glycosyltransferase family 2 protein [Litoribacter populi]